MKRIILQKEIYYSFFLIFALVIFSCSNENSTEPEKDEQNPIVSIISPITNSVLADTVTIKLNATDNTHVSKVEFYIDNIHMVDADDINEPFEYLWNLSNSEIGNIHTLFVKAYDGAGNVGVSEPIDIYYKWILLHQDEDEPFPRDINKLYIRSSATQIEFRLEMNDNWDDPHLIEGGIDWAPNENHVSYEIDGLYLGKSKILVNNLPKSNPFKNSNQSYYLKQEK